jgi:hypothetical protein
LTKHPELGDVFSIKTKGSDGVISRNQIGGNNNARNANAVAMMKIKDLDGCFVQCVVNLLPWVMNRLDGNNNFGIALHVQTI